jgi:predicted nucleic acid-binding protein
MTGGSQRRIDSKVIVDSWAWVELFKGSIPGARAKEHIESAEDAFTPSIVLAELARKYHREAERPPYIRRRLQAITESTQLVDIDAALAEEAGRASAELAETARERSLESPGLADAVILASARMLKAKVLTGDQHFRGLPDTEWLGP